MNIKTVILNELDKQDSEMLSEIVHNSLQDMGIDPASFAFSISVDYTEDKA